MLKAGKNSLQKRIYGRRMIAGEIASKQHEGS
jgi:hypothetical protein